MQAQREELEKLRTNEQVVKVGAQLLAKVNSLSMAKSSQEYVDRLELCVLKAMVAGKINSEHLLALAKGSKTFNYNSVSELKSTLATQLKKGVDANAQNGKSAAHKKYNELVPLLSELVEAIKDVGSDHRHIGTFAQMKVMMDVTAKVRQDAATLMFPAGRELMMGSFIYNQMTFNEAHKIIHTRWVIVTKLFDYLSNHVEIVKPGSVSGGYFIKSGFYKLKNSKFPNEYSDEVAQPKAGEDNTTLLSFNNVAIDKTNFVHFLAAAYPIDVRFLMQTSTFKQSRNDPVAMASFKKKVVGMALMVIKSVHPGYSMPAQLNLSKDGEFMKHYFACSEICRTTLRTFNRDIYGAKGGADTRSKTNMESITGVAAGSSKGFSNSLF